MLIDALQIQLVVLHQQLAPLVPLLNRSAAGQWTLNYTGPAHDYWQVWVRSSGNAAWGKTGEMGTSAFPATDDNMVPTGVSWWQVKICEADGEWNPATPFSNIHSFGPVPLLAYGRRRWCRGVELWSCQDIGNRWPLTSRIGYTDWSDFLRE